MLGMILPTDFYHPEPPPAPTSVVVKAGDTLSKLAQEFGDDLAKLLGWNPEVTAADPNGNLIYPGERIALAADGPHSPVAPYSGRHRASGSAGAAAALYGPGTTTPAPASNGSGGHSAADLAYEACVISRESGGDAQITNASDHWGLFQFSRDTWAAYGGDPALFGNASASYQIQIFWNVMAAGNEYGTWSEWDYCPLP